MRNPQLLVVDNIELFREALARNLERAGCQVARAATAEKALELAGEAPVDLALVDLRLRSEGDENDTSGVLLCRELKQSSEAFCVLMTGHRTSGQEITRWKNRGDIDDHQSKLTKATDRHEEIRGLLERCVPTHFNLRITFAGEEVQARHWTELAKAVEDPTPYWNEVSHLFHRLFPKHIASADIVPMESGSGGEGVVQVLTEDARTGLKEQVIVKYGYKDRVRTESDRFEQFLAPLGPHAMAPVRWFAESRRFAAIAYSFVRVAQNANCYTLAAYLTRPDCSPRDEECVLSSIFFEVCKPWYEEYMQPRARRPSAVIASPKCLRLFLLAHLWPDRSEGEAAKKLKETQEWVFEQNGVEHADDRLKANVGEVSAEVPDPVTFALAEEHDASWSRIERLCVTHGDMHPRNIFVLRGTPCIIDFADTNWGHPFRDFAMLEVSLRFGVLYGSEDAEAIWKMEQMFADLSHYPSWQEFEGRPGSLGQAARLTYLVRQQARRLSSRVPEWESQYAAVLLFSLLKLAGIKRVSGSETPEHAVRRRILAYLAAGAMAGQAHVLLRLEKRPTIKAVRGSVPSKPNRHTNP